MQSTNSDYGSPYLAACHFTFTFFTFILYIAYILYSHSNTSQLERRRQSNNVFSFHFVWTQFLKSDLTGQEKQAIFSCSLYNDCKKNNTQHNTTGVLSVLVEKIFNCMCSVFSGECMSFIYMFNHVMPLSSDGFLETEQELITISFSQSYSVMLLLKV